MSKWYKNKPFTSSCRTTSIDDLNKFLLFYDIPYYIETKIFNDTKVSWVIRKQ